MLVQALQVGARAGVYQTFVDAGAHVAELLLSLHHAPSQDRRLPPELGPYIGSILAERAQRVHAVADSWLARHGVLKSSRTERAALNELADFPTNASLKSCRLRRRP